MGIFGRELFKILNNRSPEPEARTDHVWYPLRRMGILPQIILRLQMAATNVTDRTSLQPRDFEMLIQSLPCSADEEKQLRVALIAQGVESFLMGRMMRHKESIADAVQIAQIVNNRLLQSFETSYILARGDPDPQGLEQQITTILILTDRAGEMVQEMHIAQQEQDDLTAKFWNTMAIGAYEHLSNLLQKRDQELARSFALIIKELKGMK